MVYVSRCSGAKHPHSVEADEICDDCGLCHANPFAADTPCCGCPDLALKDNEPPLCRVCEGIWLLLKNFEAMTGTQLEGGTQ